jgi:hypothetical protein
MSKWINFEQSGDTGKTKIWRITTKEEGFVLGEIKWYAPWRKYSFFPLGETIYENTCLMDIVNFIQTQTEVRKNVSKQRSN